MCWFPCCSTSSAGTKLEAYKAAVVGLNGEIEHASGFIHTLRFGNRFREAVGGTSYLAFTNKRGLPDADPDPVDAQDRRRPVLYHLTAEFAIADARVPDDRRGAWRCHHGRAHPRIGNRYLDMEEMAKERARPGAGERPVDRLASSSPTAIARPGRGPPPPPWCRSQPFDLAAQCAALSKRHRVIAYDLLGHGAGRPSSRMDASTISSISSHE